MRAPSTRSAPSSDWELGRLAANDATQDRRLGKLEDQRERDRAELDRVKHWLERSLFLALLAVTSVTGHAMAPALGSMIGGLLRGLAGLRGG